VEFRIVWPDQSVHWVQCRGRTIYDSNNRKPLRMLGTVIDITTRKKHQEDLQKALLEAKSASDLKSAFLANMSHEIRTPLGAILGFAEILADPTTTENDRAQFVSIIERNGRMLSRLIDDILDLSKVESGHLQLEIVDFSLKKTIDAFWPNLKLASESKSLPLKLSIDSNTPDQISGDPTRWTQILLNLLQNAIKFTERGQVRLDVYERDNKIHFQVTDTGIGMSPEQRSQLFFAFRQADESITRRYGGTGLGLALSKKMAQLLGGDIQLLESQIGSGSRFLVTLPIRYKKPQSQTRVF
jgi:signal transduction histidine kinase